MKKIHLYFFCAISLLLAVGCKSGPENKEDLDIDNKDDVQVEKKEKLGVVLTAPEGFEAELSEINITFTNKETGKVTEKNAQNNLILNVELLKGIYDVLVEAKALLKNDETKHMSAQVSNVSVSENSVPLYITLLPEYKGAFVIKEIFYSGATNDKTKRGYMFAHYVIINNNSNELQYADSLVFAGTAANTAIISDNYRPLLPEVVTDFMFMIPGKGKSVPVKPGEDIVICMEAKNHQEIASNAPDLSKKADFEWFEPNEYYQLTDNPDVPNMSILFKTSRSITSLHTRGFVSYFIFKLPMSYEELMKEHSKSFPYPNPRIPPIDRPIIPDTWIMDGIDLHNTPNIPLKALPSSVDKSHSFCTATSLGYTLQRKVFYKTGKREVYLDNNDSMNDFNRDQPSSIL